MDTRRLFDGLIGNSSDKRQIWSRNQTLMMMAEKSDIVNFNISMGIFEIGYNDEQ